MSLDASFDPSATGRSDAPTPKPQKRNLSFLWRRFITILQFLSLPLSAPIKVYSEIRQSMTVASVAVLLSAFMTLNVIWGFPWSGMMGGCFAMLVVGFLINRIIHPRLQLSVSLPRVAVAGEPFSLNVRLTNQSRLPAMNLRLGWHREGVREIYRRKRTDEFWDASPPVPVDLLRSGAQVRWNGAMLFTQRGIHELPPFQVSSTFPFHLFCCREAIATKTKIAITPKPASPDDDPSTRILLSSIGDWSKQLIAGAPVEYIGNREYQEGVAVRRWDFASWARLGRPIVREYQSPSIQAVTLIIDTSQRAVERGATRSQTRREKVVAQQAFERLLSIATTAIAEVTARRIQVSLVLTSESEQEDLSSRIGYRSDEDHQRMLVRLAAAKPVDPLVGTQRLKEAIDEVRGQPTLVFSLINAQASDRDGKLEQLPPSVSFMLVHATKQQSPTSRRKPGHPSSPDSDRRRQGVS